MGKEKEISVSALPRSLNCISKGMINYARLTPSSLKMQPGSRRKCGGQIRSPEQNNQEEDFNDSTR
jgi:hypothetical protein